MLLAYRADERLSGGGASRPFAGARLPQSRTREMCGALLRNLPHDDILF
jgi:hypothetical protein